MSSESASVLVGTAIGSSVAGVALAGRQDGPATDTGWADGNPGRARKHGRGSAGTSIQGDREGALAVGAPDPCVDLIEAIEGSPSRMSVAVAVARTDGGQPWAQRLQQQPARRGGAAVVGHLEQIPTTTVVGDALEDVGVVIVLQISGEQHALVT